jgi:hypothetical protein
MANRKVNNTLKVLDEMFNEQTAHLDLQDQLEVLEKFKVSLDLRVTKHEENRMANIMAHE